MLVKKINIYNDKTIEPCRLVVGEQYENEVVKVQFVLPSTLKDSNYFFYAVLISPNTKRQFAVPLDDEYGFVVINSITETAGDWGLHLLAKTIKMENGDATTGKVYLSPRIACLVRKNNIRIDELENQELEANIQIVYDKLLIAIKKAEEALEKAEEMLGAGTPGNSDYSGIQIGETPQDFKNNSYLFLKEVGEV